MAWDYFVWLSPCHSTFLCFLLSLSITLPILFYHLLLSPLSFLPLSLFSYILPSSVKQDFSFSHVSYCEQLSSMLLACVSKWTPTQVVLRALKQNLMSFLKKRSTKLDCVSFRLPLTCRFNLLNSLNTPANPKSQLQGPETPQLQFTLPKCHQQLGVSWCGILTVLWCFHWIWLSFIYHPKCTVISLVISIARSLRVQKDDGSCRGLGKGPYARSPAQRDR